MADRVIKQRRDHFGLSSSGGNSAAEIHSENFCLSKCSRFG